MRLMGLYLLTLGLSSLSFSGLSQEVCLVTCDFQTGENNLIMWEELADNTNLDSMLVYRKSAGESSFSKIGSVKIGGPTFFTDDQVDTKVINQYRIATLDSNGVVGAPSMWHQPMTLDYVDNGLFTWTSYEREDGFEPYYIELLVDETGLGIYNLAGGELQASGTVTWLDDEFSSRPVGTTYFVRAEVSPCNISTKANINTSRSNIKQAISTGSLGINDAGKTNYFNIYPNPTSDHLQIVLNDTEVNARYEIIAVSGELVLSGTLDQKETNLNLSQLASGFYTVTVYATNQQFKKPFVKQ